MILAFSGQKHKRAWIALVEAGQMAIDEAFQDLESLRGSGLGIGTATSAAALVDAWDSTIILAEALPRQYLDRYTALFLKRFVVCLVGVAGKLASPHADRLASTAEELAMWSILELARARREMEKDGRTDVLGYAEDFLFEDTDFLFLFDPKFDGMDETDVGKYHGMQSLRFEAWLKPFSKRYWVHPYGQLTASLHQLPVHGQDGPGQHQ